MNAASHANRKALRTLLQVVAAGGLSALVAAVANGLSPAWAGVLVAGATVLVTWAQNYLEASGTVPEVLPPPTPLD